MSKQLENSELKNEFQRIKVSNSYAIGGMIGAGKSTLSRALGNELNADVVFELNEDDKLQNLLLEKLYEGDKTSAIAFQVYFFCSRFDNYKNGIKNNNLTVFDRTIFEDRLFAHQNMTSDPIMFGFYDSMWHDKVKELIYSVGVPKLYIILDLKWEEFKDRIFRRGRKSEVDNFSKNEHYFKSVHKMYFKYLVNVCEVYGINYIVIDASLATDQQIKSIMHKIKKDGLEKDKI
ncbi:MAG: deoxynucleoside kinase [Mycoplasmataceae bacterium]|nr:deoxynucleoside kinase [Mycoplasmataceae bacterium]